MKRTFSTLQMSIRITGLIMVILGGIFWITQWVPLVFIHILLGFTLVFLLWGLVYRAARAGVAIALVGITTAWSTLLPVLGFLQAQLIAGSLHWIIHLIHLLAGLIALALAEIINARITPRIPLKGRNNNARKTIKQKSPVR